MSKKVFIRSFGCQMNKLDTTLIAAALQQAGFNLVGSAEKADAVLINTCSVREHAEKKVFSHLGELKNLKNNNPSLIVGVIGCMAQRLGTDLLNEPVVDIVCGPTQIAKTVELLAEAFTNRKKILAVTEKIRRSSAENPALEQFESVYSRSSKNTPSQAFVRVMRGCDNFCSYCIVPYVRGPEVSRPPETVVKQIKRLADEGVRQVTLLGQAVNKYQYRAGEKTYCLADLFYMISEIEAIEWIRFVTSYPTERYFGEIMQAMAGLPKVCNCLHMPAQSGSDKTLKAMNRNYTAEQYLDLLGKARQFVPDIALAGDFIVGFPAETEQDFAATAELVKKTKYKNCFIFKYSPRPGTKADKKLDDTVPDDVKKKRNYELLSIQEKISEQLSKRFSGQTVKVLVAGLSKKPHLNSADNKGWPQLAGRTAEDWIVVFNGPAELTGRFVNVKITKTSPLTLFGEPAGE